MTEPVVKFYVQSNNNAPQITNRYGCILDILDACLVNGMAIGSVVSLTAASKLATITFGAAHNLLANQWLKVTGANQAEYNGEFRVVTVVSSTVVTFELTVNASVSPATGSINCSLAPLDWDKPFSSVNGAGGGRGAYRSKNTLLPNRPYLRVIDERPSAYNTNYAKYAKVGIVEEMTAINTMSGVQAPYITSAVNRNWDPTGSGSTIKNGWAKWYYATVGDNQTDAALLTDFTLSNGQWLLIGNGNTFYILPSTTLDAGAPTLDKTLAFIYGFGEFTRLMDDDVFVHFLASSNAWESAAAISQRVGAYSSGIATGLDAVGDIGTSGVFLQRGYKKTAYGLATGEKVNFSGSAYPSGSTLLSNEIMAPSKTNALILKTPLLLEAQSSLFLLRGLLPIIKVIPHESAFADLEQLSQQGRRYLAKNIQGTSTGQFAQVMFDLGG